MPGHPAEPSRNEAASAFMRERRADTLRSPVKIEHILQPHGGGNS